jgi:hypothetical protein
MSTPAQVQANRANSQKSTGPTSGPGRKTSSRNSSTFGISKTGGLFFFLPLEREEDFVALEYKFISEHKPQTITESVIVRRMVESEWLRNRALCLQMRCYDSETGMIGDEKQFALLLRYESMHERAFYKAVNELQKLRKEKRKEEIGFVSQKRSAEVHTMKQEAFEMKKQQFEMKKSRSTQPAQSEIQPTAADSRPESLEMAA